MHDGKPPTAFSGSVTSGQTTATIAIAAAAGAGVKNRCFVEHISLAAAGYVTIGSASTVISNRFFFPIAGTYYVGQEYETAANEALNLLVTLDVAAGGSGVHAGGTARVGVSGTTPGSTR